MFLLILLWLLLGIVVGLLAMMARVDADSDTMNQPLWRKVWLVGLGTLVAFAGGWLGLWLVGQPFAAAMALWIAIVCVIVVARIHQAHHSFP